MVETKPRVKVKVRMKDEAKGGPGGNSRRACQKAAIIRSVLLFSCSYVAVQYYCTIDHMPILLVAKLSNVVLHLLRFRGSH